MLQESLSSTPTFACASCCLTKLSADTRSLAMRVSHTSLIRVRISSAFGMLSEALKKANKWHKEALCKLKQYPARSGFKKKKKKVAWIQVKYTRCPRLGFCFALFSILKYKDFQQLSVVPRKFSHDPQLYSCNLSLAGSGTRTSVP